MSRVYRNKKSDSRSLEKLTLTAMLCAVSIVLSALESMVEILPFMIPGMKLGLSNVAVMFSLEVLSLPSALCVVLFKAISREDCLLLPKGDKISKILRL